MAQNDIIDIDPLILQRLDASATNAKATAGVPNVGVPSAGAFFMPAGTPGLAGASIPNPEDDFIQPMREPIEAKLQRAGVLNEGAPTDLRFQLSTSTLFDPKLQTKNVEHNLKRYFKDAGLTDDEYDFGVRVGPVSNRLEFKDPRYDGSYNVIDAFGVKDIIGDFADISVDTVLPIAAELAAGIGTAVIPGVGQVPGTPLIAAAMAATTTSFGRLVAAQQLGYLSPDITSEDIVFQALKEGGLSLGFGLGGQAAFKLFKPVLRGLGLANPKFNFDIDEETFIRAYDKYMDSPAGKLAVEKDIVPSSAQILEAAAENVARTGGRAGAAEAGIFQSAAEELAAKEAEVAASPAVGTAEAVLMPSRVRTAKAEDLVRTEAAAEPMPAGVRGTAEAAGESERAALGAGIQTEARVAAETLEGQAQRTLDLELANVQSIIDDAVNLPPTKTDPAQIGAAAQEAINESYQKAANAIGKAYENVFERWSAATGISIDSVIPGKGGIKPSEAARLAADIRKTFADRPFLNEAERKVVNRVYDNFVTGERGGALSVKNVSLRTINENLRDLRRLERQAYKKALSGEDAPYPETLSKMVSALEDARKRVLSRQGAPEGLADELRALDDSFADFSTKFRNSGKSAVAKLRTANNPEAAFRLLFQKNESGGSAVLDIADELKLPENADLYATVGDALRERWLAAVVKREGKNGPIKKIDVGAHNTFLNQYGKAMEAYLSPAERNALGSATQLADTVISARARNNAARAEISRRLELGGGKALEPETIFEETWKNDRISRFDEVLLSLNKDPQLMDTFKAFVYKDMFDPAQGRVKTVNGRQVIDPKAMREYLDSNKDKIGKLLGQDYLNNMRVVLDATEAALTQVPTRGARKENNILTQAVRSYVGVFTRPGRVITAFNKIRGRVREDAMTMALSDPRRLAEMAKAARRAPVTKELEKTLGRIFGRSDYEGPIRQPFGITPALDRDLDVYQPSQAQAILDELEAR